MRQVGEAELVWVLKYRLRRLAAGLRRDFASRDPATRAVAAQLLAEHLVRDGLGRYEILSDAPLPDGSDLFTAAAFGEGRGRAPSVGE